MWLGKLFLQPSTYLCIFSISIEQPVPHKDRVKCGFSVGWAGVLQRAQKISHKQCTELPLYGSAWGAFLHILLSNTSHVLVASSRKQI